MKTIRVPTGFVVISTIVFLTLVLTACVPFARESLSSDDPLNRTITSLGTETSRLVTQVTEQKQTDDSQEEAISDLFTRIPSDFETITKTPTPLPLLEFPTSFPVCTPPACAEDEMYYCPGDCPGGCGTTCATATPGVPSGTGHIFGEICYPGETIPEMTIYFQETSTQRTLKIPVAENQDSYRLEVPAGVYVAFAWLQNKEVGGGYTQFVLCKKTILSCTDHSLVPFLVQENHVKVDVDICDWDGDTSLFPPVPEN